MEFVKKNIGKWVTALVLLVVGILCIVAAAASGEASANAYEGISITIGVALLVVAGLVIVLALVASIMSKGEKSFGSLAASAAITLALGIFFVANKRLGGQLIWLFLGFVPYVLLVAGSIIAVDGILTIVFGIIKKNVKSAVITGVISIVIGAVAIVLGALMIGNDPVIAKDVQLIIFGIIVILYACLVCLSTFVTLPKAIAVVKVEKVEEEKTE